MLQNYNHNYFALDISQTRSGKLNGVERRQVLTYYWLKLEFSDT